MKTIVSILFILLALPVLAADEKIVQIDVIGNSRIEKEAILSRVTASKVGQIMNSTKVAEDVRTIFNLGYFQDVKVQFGRVSGRLIFEVIEKRIVREVVFSGNKEEETEKLQKETTTKPYSSFDPNRVRQDVEKLQKYYDSKGFYLADIASQITDLSGQDLKVTFNIRENKKIKIRKISFLGNKVFSDSELKSILRTKEKGFLSFINDSGSLHEEYFNVDRQILRDYYGHRGYIKVKVGNPQVQLTKDRASLTVTIPIEEGDSYRVGQVRLDGELIKDIAELQKEVSLKEGEIADTLLIQQDIMKLSGIYGDEGYAYVNVIPQESYDEEKKTVSITYMLQPGQKIRVERIRISGNHSTRDKVIRREMQIHEGEQFHATKIRESKQNLDRLSLFEDVRLSTPRSSGDDKVDITIEVKEKQTGTFSIGAGFNTVESFQIQGKIEKRNLFGYGTDISFDARVGTRTQYFNLQYRDEYFLDSKWGMEVNAFNITRVFNDFDLLSRGGSLGFDYPLYVKGLERIRAGLTYSLVSEDLTDVRSTVETLFSGGYTSSVSTYISRDTRNRVFEPSSGSFVRLKEEIAGSFLGGDNEYSKTEFDGKIFFPVLEQSRTPFIGDSVFAFHLNVGYITPLHDGDRVPIFERYFPGGIFTIRGFDLRSLGPEIPIAISNDPNGFTTTDFAIGGNKQVIFNAEYLFPLIRPANIKGVVFFDMGNAFNNGESLLTITGQRQSVGAGIHWFSPIGPLRFEWGFPLDRKEDESPLVFDFTIGSIF